MITQKQNMIAQKQFRISPGQQKDIATQCAIVVWEAAGNSIAATFQMTIASIHQKVQARFPYATPNHVYRAVHALAEHEYLKILTTAGSKHGLRFEMTELTRALINTRTHEINPRTAEINPRTPETYTRPAASECANSECVTPVTQSDPLTQSDLSTLTDFSAAEQSRIDRLYQLADDLLLAGDAAKFKAASETQYARAELLAEELRRLTATNARLIARINELKQGKNQSKSEPLPPVVVNKRPLQAAGRLMEALFGATRDGHTATIRALEKCEASPELVQSYCRAIFDTVGRG